MTHRLSPLTTHDSRRVPDRSALRGSAWLAGFPLVMLLASACIPASGGAADAESLPVTTAVTSEAGLPAPAPKPDTRIFGIIPNYRTSLSLNPYKPLSVREKFAIARQDSFDRGTVALAAVFAADNQLTNASPSFGQGAAGYGHYLAAGYTDLVIGNYLSEGVFPALLHQDPRYFRRGVGSGLSRLGYSVGQIFWTHTDSGRTQFNYSEILGNASAVAISNAYYPDSRTAGDATSKLSVQLGVDMASNVLKEFWPDVSRKFSHKARN